MASRESEQALRRRREYQTEMVLGSMALSIPLLALAAIFTGLVGVIVVCSAARRDRGRVGQLGQLPLLADVSPALGAE